jgi:hypothetical protein
MNQELGAQAFTHGSDVYFGAGKSPGNNELTAHELTHVVQQTGEVQRKFSVEKDGGQHTQQLDERTTSVMKRVTSPVRPLIQRKGDSNPDKKDPVDFIKKHVDSIKSIIDVKKQQEKQLGSKPYEILNGLWIRHMLKVLESLESGGYFNILNTSFEENARGVHKKRIEVAMRAVQNRGKLPREKFSIQYKAILDQIPEKDKIEIIYYVDSNITNKKDNLNVAYEKAIKTAKNSNDIIDWGKAAQLLNGFSPEDITKELIKLDYPQIKALHEGALTHPRVGANSNIAKFTQPVSTDVRNVKSLAIHSFSTKEIAGNWNFLNQKFKRRNKIIQEVDKLGYAQSDQQKNALNNLNKRWARLKKLLSDSQFNPATGLIQTKANFTRLINAEKQDLAALQGRLFKSMRGEVNEFLKALQAYLDNRWKLDQEQTQFHRFDQHFNNTSVSKLVKFIPHASFNMAEIKALTGQESADFTNITIAGIDPKKPGLQDRTKNPGSFIGIGQHSTGARNEAITWAKGKGVTIQDKPDPRTIPLESIKLTAAYLGRVMEDLLFPGLPNPKPSGDELKKMGFAAYNGGHDPVKEAAKSWVKNNENKVYTWNDIKGYERITNQMRDYVEEIGWRLQ